MTGKHNPAQEYSAQEYFGSSSRILDGGPGSTPAIVNRGRSRPGWNPALQSGGRFPTQPRPGRKKGRPGKGRPEGISAPEKEPCGYLTRWPETSFVSSNMLTDFFPFSTGLSLSSALIWVRTFLS